MTMLVYCFKVCAQAFPAKQFNFHHIVGMSRWRKANRQSAQGEKPAFAEMRGQASSTTIFCPHNVSDSRFVTRNADDSV